MESGRQPCSSFASVFQKSGNEPTNRKKGLKIRLCVIRASRKYFQDDFLFCLSYNLQITSIFYCRYAQLMQHLCMSNFSEVLRIILSSCQDSSFYVYVCTRHFKLKKLDLKTCSTATACIFIYKSFYF